MVETKTKRIDGKEVMVTQFPAFEGLRVKTKLLKVFGPAIGAVFSSGVATKDIMEKNINFTAVIETLAEHLDEDGTPELFERLLSSTRIGGKEVTREVFNMEFAGSYSFLYKVLAFVLETNRFFDFLSTGGIADKLRAVKPMPTASQD